MTILDDLKRMYGQDPDPVAGMMAVEPPPPPELDPQVISATSSDMSQPMDSGAQGGSALGHPDVLSYLKELEGKGAFKAQEKPSPPEGMVATETTIKSEQGGPTARQRAEGVAAEGAADMADMDVDRQRRNKEADELEKRAAYLRQDAAVEDEKRQRQEQELEAKQTRLRGQQQELADQHDEPVNAERYLQNKSFAGKALSVISAGIYGFLGGRGQPPVVETLMQMAKEDTLAQIQNNAANRDRRNSLIDQYERQYGDTELVRKRLEADKLLTMAKMTRAEGLEAKTVELRGTAEDMAAKLENQVGRLHSEIQQATYGKPVEVSTTYGAPKGAKGPDAFGQMKKGLELDKLYEERGMPADAPERVAARRMAGITESQRGDSKPVTEQDQQVKKDVDVRRHKYSEEDRELADEEQALVSAMSALGGAYDPDTGSVQVPKDMAGAGIGAVARNIPFTDASYAAEALSNLADVKQRQRSGAAAPVAEELKLRKIASGANAYDEESVRKALEQMAASLYARRRAAMTGAGSDVLKSYSDEGSKLPKRPTVTIPGRITR